MILLKSKATPFSPLQKRMKDSQSSLLPMICSLFDVQSGIVISAERNLPSRLGAGEGGVVHGEVGWVELRKASQPIVFSDEGTVGNGSAVPRVFWQREW